MHNKPSLSLLYAPDGVGILRLVRAIQHEVVLLIQRQFLSLPLTCQACTVHTDVQVVLDGSQLVPVLRARHLPLMEIHGCDALPVVPVYVCAVDLIFEARLIGLIAQLTVVSIDTSEYSRPRQASVVDLVIVATRMDF